MENCSVDVFLFPMIKKVLFSDEWINQSELKVEGKPSEKIVHIKKNKLLMETNLIICAFIH